MHHLLVQEQASSPAHGSKVKELLENALDAGATSVEVRFKEHGVDAIEVQDNGRGIDHGDWAGIGASSGPSEPPEAEGTDAKSLPALKHHTSKLSTYADLDQVITLGFRGEALSSLCGTAELSVTTSTATTAPAGTSLIFAPSGECIVGGKVARSKGTTVTVKELFKSLPVRRKDLIKNSKREFGKAVELVQSYAVIKTGCRIEVKNCVKGKWTTHLQTQSAPTVRGNYSSLFTPKALAPMMELDLELDVAADKSVLKWSEGASAGFTKVHVKGLISKPTTGSGRTSTNRQFYYVNGRPFTPTKVAKAVNETYKSFNTGSFPSVVADFQLPPGALEISNLALSHLTMRPRALDAYDVNVSPDKRTIFLHSEGNLIAALTVSSVSFLYQFMNLTPSPSQAALQELFQPSRSTYSMTQIGGTSSTSASTPLPSRKRVSNSTPLFIKEPTSESDLEDAKEGEEEEARMSEEEVHPPPAKRRRGSSLASEDIDKDDSETVESPPEPAKQETPLAPEEPDEALGSPTHSSPQEFELNHDTESYNPIASTSSPLLSQNRLSTQTSPSVSRSPSPVPQSKLRQVTLDTTFAAWSQNPKPVAAKAKGKGKALDSAQEKLKSLRQFFNPTQIQSVGVEDDNVDQLGSEMEGEEEDLSGDLNGDGVEDEELGEEEDPGSTGAEDDPDSEDELMVIEDSFKPSHAMHPPCACSHSTDVLEISDNSDNEDDGDHFEPGGTSTYEDERLEHLASLDADANAAIQTLDEILGLQVGASDLNLDFDMTALVSHWTAPPPTAALPSWATQAERDPLAGASVEQDVERAEEILSRVVSKEDFGRMKVIGQFNLGFIIARRTVQPDEEELGELAQDDLFIVDQHASDEKYNFERLQQDTIIQSQRLLQSVLHPQIVEVILILGYSPRALNLPSHEEITALDNIKILKMNGFEVLVDEEAAVGQRVKLTAQPVSKDTVWGVEDLEELLDKIISSATGEVVRPTKTRKMFASRACRKSVMIGKALTKNQMTSVVRHMGEMDQPWSCPHGRPTMRWLAGLGSHTTDERSRLSSVLQAYT
ncbi:DNA mismatch repair protein PMS2, partial [Phenoliferia sp. Uapishka_3]